MDGVTPETCGECGFDAGRWRRRDVVSYLAALGFWYRLAFEGIHEDDLNRRPEPGVWSPLEYAGHTAVVLAMLRAGVEAILAVDGIELPPVPDPPPPEETMAPSALDREAILDDVEREATALAVLVAEGPAEAWANVGRSPGETIQAEAAVIHAAHDASHHTLDVARGLAALGVGAPRQEARVTQINASGGGVPKLPIDDVEVDAAGVVGDRQADAKHHGRPFQALCLWSTEVIDGLAADGHPIGAGSAGENLTLTGIDWDTMRPGALLQVGDVLAEVSFPATPCAKQTKWFTDGDFGRLDHDRNPGLTRWYAWVREPGVIRTGDPAMLG